MINKTKDTVIYKATEDFIRSTKHEFNNYLNYSKMNFISDFITEYRRMLNLCLDELYNKTYYYTIKNTNHHFNLKYRIFTDDKCGIPSYFQVSKFNCLKYLLTA